MVFCAGSSTCKQRVKLERDCKSEWGDIPAGVPQGTNLGPWIFVLMIDDINTSDIEIWNYVDDTTIADPEVKNQASTIQDYVNDLVAKSDENKFQLNESKCKEISISFVENEAEFAPIVIQCQATWPQRFHIPEIELSRVRNFMQALHKALLPQATEECNRCNQRTHIFFKQHASVRS